MTCTLRHHMSKRWFKIFYLIHHYVLYLAYGMVFHVTERCMKKSVCKAVSKTLQHVISHIVRHACRQGEHYHFYKISRKGYQAPFCHGSFCDRFCHKQANELIHTIKRHTLQPLLSANRLAPCCKSSSSPFTSSPPLFRLPCYNSVSFL